MDCPRDVQETTGPRKRARENEDEFVDDMDEDDFSDDDISIGQDMECNDCDVDDEEPHIKQEEADNTANNDDDAADDYPDEDVDPDAVYNERMEAYPELAAYDAEVPLIKEKLVGIVEQILSVFGINGCQTPFVMKQIARGKALLQIPPPEPIKIALLGDTGAGMSDLFGPP
jgi:hypothetical protein